MKKIKLIIFLVLELLLLVVTVRALTGNPIKEGLACQSTGKPTEVNCTRTLKYVHKTRSQTYYIPNVQTIALDDEADAWSDFITLKFSITGIATDYSKIILLNVPEKNTGYASTLVQKIKALPEAQSPPVLFERNNIYQVIMLPLIVLSLAILFAFMFLKRPR